MEGKASLALSLMLAASLDREARGMGKAQEGGVRKKMSKGASAECKICGRSPVKEGKKVHFGCVLYRCGHVSDEQREELVDAEIEGAK